MDLIQAAVKMQGPSIRGRLRANVVPFGAEKVTIVHALQAAQTCLSTMQTDPSASAKRLKRSIEEITLITFIAEYSSILSKVRQLPDGILQLIFLHSDLHGYLYTGNRDSEVEIDTWHITSVCSHWRAILLDMPVWWSCISTSITAGPLCLSRLELFLRRSKNAPLSIALWAREDPDQYQTARPPNPEIVQALTREAGRWKYLSTSRDIELASLPGKHFPSLESLAIASTDGFGKIVYAPKLRAVSLRNVHRAQLGQKPAFALQILQLSANMGSGEMCQPLLSLFPNTIHFTISTKYKTPWRGLPDPNPHLSVRTLVFLGHEMRAYCVLEMLDVLNLPNLERLELIDCCNWDFRSIDSHMKRSGCALKELSLQSIRIRGPQLLELLRILPTLEKLEIIGSWQIPNSITDAVILGLGPTDKPLLSSLTNWVMHGTYLFSTDTLLHMLEYRFGDGKQCRTPTVVDIILRDRSFSVADLERFAALPAAGGRVSLEFLDEDRQ
ncbi:hypothetical protein B0H16DRAFT_1688404 [Mycena metata]|uniref:F-box domain-containing protein n=1 Tax=Mycena metata TaxID=1033252 RepID=A0AAD7NI68_9AGAR|nr:hypothetical protein B0H16DRAFT_1688404 [Mycena metata]